MAMVKQMERRWLWGVLLWLLAILALPASAQVRTQSQPLNVANEFVWTKSSLSVCWETGGYPGAKQHVRDAVTSSWQANSRLTFTGWQACTSSGANIRIKIADEGPHVKVLGKALDNKRNGMVLNFTFRNWSTSCGNQGAAQKTLCVKSTAVHEFGHALGFAHEQNRPDSLCGERNQGGEGNVLVGAWDLSSTMNYCNPVYNNAAVLSATDIAGVQIFYGVPASRRVTPPGGSYRRNCSDTAATATTLSSRCRGRSGTVYATALPDYARCTGDIANRDGRLVCTNANPLPGGSWKASCIDAAVQGDTLAASCKNRSGDFKRTQLVGFGTCNTNSISNNDGQLVCSRGTIPAGSYQSSCRMVQRRGTELFAQCRQPGGRWVNSSIKRVDLCTGPISNDDGVMKCANGRAVPQGSYRDSCRGWFADGPDLVASCRDKSGNRLPSRLPNVAACSNQPYNNDGKLACRR